ALLALRLRQRNSQPAPQPISRPAMDESETTTFPLSSAQRRIWFLEQLEPGRSTFNAASVFRLSGRLQIDGLQCSVNEIVRRHDSLRTVFTTMAGEPVQIVKAAASVALPVIDLSRLEPAIREQQTRQVQLAAAQRPFDLQRDQLLRIELLRLDEHEHLLVIVMHHIIADGWSVGVFARELAEVYAAWTRGERHALPPLPIRYVDYALWQQQSFGGAALSRQLEYWKQQLRGQLPILELPTDRPRSKVTAQCGARHAFTLPLAVSAAIAAFSQREGVTPFMTLLAAFNVLLSRYSGQQDIVVGSPIAGRTRSELEELIGCFVNMLALRVDLTGNLSFRDLLSRVRGVALGAYAHQDLPFEKLVDALQPERTLHRTPLFQVAFALQNVPHSRLKLPNLTIEQIEFDSLATAEYDLTLYITDSAGSLSGAWEYNPDLFDAATVARLQQHFAVLLEHAIARPEQRIDRLPLLTKIERHTLLHEWSATERSRAHADSFLDCFAAQIERNPDAIAVSFEDAQLTYAQLDRRANQLAHELQRRGVGPDVCVGVCVERSPEMIVGLLAALKAGGAYVPLDPGYPADRLRFMLADTAAPVVLTQQRFVSLLRAVSRSGEHAAQVICLDADQAAIEQQPAHPPRSAATPEHLAYVIYTSGSTGQPKGAMIQRGSLDNFVTTVTAEYALSPADRALQFTSISWDTSVEEIFPCLTHGAALVLRPPTMLDSMGVFLRTCEEERITVLNLPTAVWHTLAASLNDRDLQLPESLRLVIIGGERARPECLLAWQQHTRPDVLLLNTYGLAEASVEVTRCTLTATPDATPEHQVSIGRPYPSVEVFVLDIELQPVPIGVAGELYVGGPGLARGYLNRPDLTAARFVPDPFTSKPGARLYKTGDRVRYRGDGSLEYLERSDQQVKIRGHRIELGEIEAAIALHPGVREVVVVARQDTADTRLVAYVVGKNQEPRTKNLGGEQKNKETKEQRAEQRTENKEQKGHQGTTLPPSPAATEAEARRGSGQGGAGGEGLSSTLRDFLAEYLPDYMVPSAFVVLDALPLTPNGKVDLRSLPAPEQHDHQQRYTPPHTPVEATLARIWADTLGLEQVGIHDNFFQLGGDSIISIQVITRANQSGLQLTPRQIFEHQTIAGLARVVGSTAAVEAEQGIVTGALPLTPIQHWFFEQYLSAPEHWNQAILLDIRQHVDATALRQAVVSVLAQHDALRLRFEQGPDGWRQSMAAPDEQLPFEQIDLSGLPAKEQTAQIETIAAGRQASLDLGAGPLLRVVLFQLEPQGAQRLLIVVHHLAIDGVSWRILLADLQAAYHQAQSEQPILLPPKTTSYREWAHQLARYAESDAAQAELDYWRSLHWSRVASLPVDRSNGENTEATARTVEVQLSPAETRCLLRDLPGIHRCQINDLLLSALLQTFTRWTNAPALLVDVEGHGREEIGTAIDLSSTVGWFTSIFPVLLEGGAASATETLAAVKAQLRRMPRRGFGYGVLRYLGRADVREMLRSLPQAEVSFNYLGQFDQTLPPDSLFAQTSESHGPIHSPLGRRSYLLDVDGYVVAGQLHITWTYSEYRHHRATIERLAQGFVDALRALIQSADTLECAYTPADFPLAALDQPTLDRLIHNRPQIADLYPLAPMQRTMLAYLIDHPESEAYSLQECFRLDGRIDVPAFKQAWQTAFDRHAVLRTAFEWQGLAEPLQVVLRAVDVPWIEHDLRQLSRAEQRSRQAEIIEATRRQRFDLTQAPLMCLTLLRLADDRQVVVWSAHHLIIDGWSFQLLLKDVIAAYEAARAGRRPEPEPAGSYREYIAWARQQDAERAAGFWHKMFAGFQPAHTAFGEWTGAAAASARYADQQIHLAAETTAALNQFTRQNQITMSTLLQGAWALLLSHVTHEPDVVYGLVSASRPPAIVGVETRVGLYLNTLPLRVRIPAALSVLDWLRQLQTLQVTAQQYDYVSSQQIQTWCDLPATQPLFEATFRFQNYPSSPPDAIGGLQVAHLRSVDSWHYPLNLVVAPATELLISLSYDRRCFEAVTITALLQQLCELLTLLIAQPTQPALNLHSVAQERAVGSGNMI
ncbi:MAG TPA: amino acid adenylation domain-containing protein, partial [Herpetosiphonaceae bacterium]